jgi:predicted DNA-binding transcriptional regulator YafY
MIYDFALGSFIPRRKSPVMARNEQLIRQHRVLQILERHRFGRTLEELRDDLMREMGLPSLHERSVRRDLDALQKAGVDVIIQNSKRGKIWKLGATAGQSHKITASATELIALSLSRDLLYPLAGTPFWIGIESFWNKLREQLPAAVWSHYEKFRQVLCVRGMPAKSYQSQHGILSTLHRAILEHRVVEIEYQSPGKDPKRRSIEPYAVAFYQSSLYIIAAAHEVPQGEERIRHWKLDRFLKAEALDRWFTRPLDFDLEQHLGHSLGIFAASKPANFRIKISQHAAPWVIEDPWHPAQQVERLKTGEVILAVKAAHELEIIPRVLALGSEAEILAPASCRRQVAKVIREMAEKYADVEDAAE